MPTYSREHATQEIKHLILRSQDNPKLPSEPKLAEMLNISRATVRSILEEFCAAGWISKHPGSGTFINQLIFRTEESFSGYMNFSRMIQESGGICTVERIRVEESCSDHKVAVILQTPDSAPIVTSQILFRSDGRPSVLCEDHFPRTLMSDDEYDHFLRSSRQPLHTYLFECSGLAPTMDATEIFSVSSSQFPELAPIFQLDTNQIIPLLELVSVQRNWKNTPMIYSRIFADTRIVSFKINRKME